MKNWISIKEKKPLDKMVVDIQLNNGNTVVGFRLAYGKHKWFYYPFHSETPFEFRDWDRITHWKQHKTGNRII